MHESSPNIIIVKYVFSSFTLAIIATAYISLLDHYLILHQLQDLMISNYPSFYLEYILCRIQAITLSMIPVAQENLIGVKIKEFSFIKEIGEGAYAKVYEVLNQKSGEPAAAKVIPKQLFKKHPKLMELVKTEIRVLKQCKNENVVKYIDNFMSEKSVIIVMELCDGGELQAYLEKKTRLTQAEAIGFIKQIINGFKGLHQVDAMHRDFKAANVLLHKNQCKIADLGFAKQVKQESLTRTLLGTGQTMAPEVHQQKAYGRKADIWSLGVVFYQLVYGQYPFKGFTDKEILQSIKNTIPRYDKVSISEKTKNFIQRCLTVDPKQRMAWKEVYIHPLIVEEEEIKFALNKSDKMLKQNEIFYKKQQPQTPQKKQIAAEIQIVQEKVYDTDIQYQKRLQIESQNRAAMDLGIKQYTSAYLNRRNNIMFIFKYIIPEVFKIYKDINANHSITLYVMSKKAYHDAKLFEEEIDKKIDFLHGKNNHFHDFVHSDFFWEFRKFLEDDTKLVAMQTHTFLSNLPQHLNEDMLMQLDIEKITHKNWSEFVKDIVLSYESELISSYDSIGPTFKARLVRLIEGLHYYRTHQQETRIQEFAKHLQGLDLQSAQLAQRQRWLQAVRTL